MSPEDGELIRLSYGCMNVKFSKFVSKYNESLCGIQIAKEL